MNNLDFINSIISGNQISVFVGAGISIDSPTNLPSSDALTSCVVFNICEEALLTDEDRNALAERLTTLRLEILFSILYKMIGEEIFYPISIFKEAKPNDNHFNIARLAKKGIIRNIYTTNFDTAIEQALLEESVPFEVFINESDYVDWPKEADKVSVFKLHGSVSNVLKDNGDISLLIEQVGKPFNYHKKKALEHALINFDFMFLGYSGCDDFDLYPILFSTKSDKMILWIQHVNSKNKFLEISGEKISDVGYSNRVERIISNRADNGSVVYKHTATYLESFNKLVFMESDSTNILNSKRSSHSDDFNWKYTVQQWAKKYKCTPVPYLIKATLLGTLSSNTKIVQKCCFDSIKISRQLNETSYLCKSLIILGIQQMSNGQFEKAVSSLKEAYINSKENKFYDLQLLSGNELGLVYTQITQFDLAKDIFLEVLNNANIEDISEEKGLLYYNLGRVFWFQNNLDETIQVWEKSIQIRKQYGDVINLIPSFFNIAEVYAQKGNNDLAIASLINGFLYDSKLAKNGISFIDYSKYHKYVALLNYIILKTNNPVINLQIKNQMEENGLNQLLKLLNIETV